MIGIWEGDVGTLKENFEYYDSKTQQRIWINQNNIYTGISEDILNSTTGLQKGSAMNWRYHMDVPVDDKIYRLTFDDWM